jgi:hypothetical protein
MHRSIQLPQKKAILYQPKSLYIVDNKFMKTVSELEPTFISGSPPTSFIHQLNKRMDVYYKSQIEE